MGCFTSQELFHDLDDFEQVMCVNVKGVTLGIKHTTTPMKIPRATGCIITTTSVAGVSGGMGPHAYTTSKHAIVGLTKNTACELGRYGIRVNCISPFRVATTMLVNAWRDDENECMNFGIPSPAEVDQMEEFVTGLTNLKDPTMRSFGEVQSKATMLKVDNIIPLVCRYVIPKGYNIFENSLNFLPI